MNSPEKTTQQPERIASSDSKAKLRAALEAVSETQVALSEEGYVDAERDVLEARAYLNQAMRNRCRG
jgi:hypothetical protein